MSALTENQVAVMRLAAVDDQQCSAEWIIRLCDTITALRNRLARLEVNASASVPSPTDETRGTP